jgi:hypothetical protein
MRRLRFPSFPPRKSSKTRRSNRPDTASIEALPEKADVATKGPSHSRSRYAAPGARRGGAARRALDLQPESRLWVAGTSTVRSFQCQAGAFDAKLESAGADAVAAVWLAKAVSPSK